MNTWDLCFAHVLDDAVSTFRVKSTEIQRRGKVLEFKDVAETAEFFLPRLLLKHGALASHFGNRSRNFVQTKWPKEEGREGIICWFHLLISNRGKAMHRYRKRFEERAWPISNSSFEVMRIHDQNHFNDLHTEKMHLWPVIVLPLPQLFALHCRPCRWSDTEETGNRAQATNFKICKLDLVTQSFKGKIVFVFQVVQLLLSLMLLVVHMAFISKETIIDFFLSKEKRRPIHFSLTHCNFLSGVNGKIMPEWRVSLSFHNME